jgi:hypothetical protein
VIARPPHQDEAGAHLRRRELWILLRPERAASARRSSPRRSRGFLFSWHGCRAWLPERAARRPPRKTFRSLEQLVGCPIPAPLGSQVRRRVQATRPPGSISRLGVRPPLGSPAGSALSSRTSSWSGLNRGRSGRRRNRGPGRRFPAGPGWAVGPELASARPRPQAVRRPPPRYDFAPSSPGPGGDC